MTVLALERPLLAAVAVAAMAPSVAMGAEAAGACARDLTQYRLQTWSVDDGLPLDTVNAIAQTPDGFLWAGTESGLARFDGHTFERDLPGLESIAEVGPFVEAMVVDADGNLLVGTGANGLLVVDASGVQVLHSVQRPVDAVTATSDGRVWFGVRGEGLLVIDAPGAPARRVTGDGDGLTTVTALAPRSRGGVWVGYPGAGVYHADASGLHRVADVDTLDALQVEAVLETDDGALHVAAREGLYQLLDGTVTRDEPVQSYVVSLWADAAGTLWGASAGHGIFRRCGDVVQRLDQRVGLPLDSVMQVLGDGAGGAWAATGGGGLAYLHPAVATPFTPHKGLPTQPMLPVLATRDGALWAGSFGGGLVRIVDDSVEVLTVEDGLPSDFVFSLAEDADGSLWVGTRAGIAQLVDGGVVATLDADDGLPAESIASLLHDGERLWAGTISALVGIGADGVHVHAPEVGDYDGYIVNLHRDSRGVLWIAVDGGGVFMLRDGRVNRAPFQDRLESTLIMGFHEAPDGALWIATGRGLARWDGESVSRVSVQHGLVDPMLFSIIDDGAGAMWVSGNSGVSRIALDALDAIVRGERDTLSPRRFTRADGMPSTETNGGFQPTATRDTRGRLWYPTMAGLARFDPAAIDADHRVPEVYVVRMQAETVSLNPATPPGAIGPRPAFIDVRFSAPEYRDTHRLEFRYRRPRIDTDWYRTADRQALYHQPGPGRFEFEVQARIGDGAWSESATVTLNVQPHLLESPWFWLLVILVVAGVGVVLVTWRYRVYARRREARQQAQKLEAVGLLAGGIAHDFNNVLAVVMSGTESIMDRLPHDSTARRDAEAVLSVAERGAALTRQLLTFSRQRPGDREWLDLASEIRGLEEFLSRLLPRGVELHMGLDPAAGRALIDRVHLQQVMLNLVTNARDAMPEGGRIEVALWATDGGACLSVGDQGSGIDPDVARRLFEPFFTTKSEGRGTGLGPAVTYGIVQGAGGRIDVRSRQGGGTVFEVFLPTQRGETVSNTAG